MTIIGHAQSLEDALKQLARVHRQGWSTPEGKDAVMRTLKTKLSEADRVLRLPHPPETDHARAKLELQAEMARGTLNTFEASGAIG